MTETFDFDQILKQYQLLLDREQEIDESLAKNESILEQSKEIFERG